MSGRSVHDENTLSGLRATVATLRHQLAVAERERDFALDVIAAEAPLTAAYAAAVAVISELQRYVDVAKPVVAVAEWIDVVGALAEYRRFASGGVAT
jgi:hypothetical protein